MSCTTRCWGRFGVCISVWHAGPLIQVECSSGTVTASARSARMTFGTDLTGRLKRDRVAIFWNCHLKVEFFEIQPKSCSSLIVWTVKLHLCEIYSFKKEAKQQHTYTHLNWMLSVQWDYIYYEKIKPQISTMHRPLSYIMEMGKNYPSDPNQNDWWTNTYTLDKGLCLVLQVFLWLFKCTSIFNVVTTWKHLFWSHNSEIILELLKIPITNKIISTTQHQQIGPKPAQTPGTLD